MTPHHHEDAPLLILTGVGRSGTTALHQALAAHRHVDSSPYVQNIVHDVLTTAHVNRTAPTRRPAMQVSDERYDALFRRLILDLVLPSPSRGPHRVPMLFTNLTRETAQYALDLFPNARLVAIVRNGVDVVRSRLAHEYLGVHSFESHCQAWTQGAELCVWAEDNERALVVRHEDLRRDGAGVLRKIEHHAGFAHDEAPARHLDDRTYHPTPPASGHEWQHWTQPQRDNFTQHCAALMEQLGYPIPWTERRATSPGAQTAALTTPG